MIHAQLVESAAGAKQCWTHFMPSYCSQQVEHYCCGKVREPSPFQHYTYTNATNIINAINATNTIITISTINTTTSGQVYESADYNYM